jgi:hypothetical protein
MWPWCPVGRTRRTVGTRRIDSLSDSNCVAKWYSGPPRPQTMVRDREMPLPIMCGLPLFPRYLNSVVFKVNIHKTFVSTIRRNRQQLIQKLTRYFHVAGHLLLHECRASDVKEGQLIPIIRPVLDRRQSCCSAPHLRSLAAVADNDFT